MGKDRALEVACGECHVTKHLLLNYFHKVDLMDKCEDAIEMAEQLKLKSNKIGSVYHTRMQEFEPSSKYNCVVLRYCIGYLDDREASLFLTRLG